jgi:hypothetical protein
MFGTELSQISLLYYLTYVASAGNLKNLLEATQNTGQEYRIKVSNVENMSVFKPEFHYF